MDLRAKITDAVYENPRADDQINAVMGVVEGEITYRADQKSLMDADEKVSDLQARVRELEAESELLQRQLDTAEGKRPGTWDTWDEHVARKEATPPEPPPKPALSLEEARKQAAEYAAAARTR